MRLEPVNVSVIVPVCNEAQVLPGTLREMIPELRALKVPFEVVLCENGSSDATFVAAKELQTGNPELRIERIAARDKGLALRRAIAAAGGSILVFFDAEYWSVDFIREGFRQLESCDGVIGSKSMSGAKDGRPFLRKAVTRIYNAFLRAFFGLRGTETRGLMMFKRAALSQILPHCVTRQFVFETELVLRAQRMGLRIVEIPSQVRELRPHGVGALFGRVPGVLWNLGKLRLALK